jgi:AbiV family abortive infection protein
MKSPDLKPAILASLQNGDRLTDDSELMLECERFPSSYAFALLAQEEYAKAFLLCLVVAGALPWSAQVKRALHDHVCKQLASVILDYLSPDIDEFLRRHDLSRIGEKRPIFPNDVLDAIHVICHERLPRERDRWWLNSTDRPLDGRVTSIAAGRLDGEKQDALYIRLGKAGDVVAQPGQVSSQSAKDQLERAKRIGTQLRPYDREPGFPQDLDSEKLIAVFRLLTGALSVDEFNKFWWAR